jgi:hypothetical protein
MRGVEGRASGFVHRNRTRNTRVYAFFGIARYGKKTDVRRSGAARTSRRPGRANRGDERSVRFRSCRRSRRSQHQGAHRTGESLAEASCSSTRRSQQAHNAKSLFDSQGGSRAACRCASDGGGFSSFLHVLKKRYCVAHTLVKKTRRTTKIISADKPNPCRKRKALRKLFDCVCIIPIGLYLKL